MRRMILDLREDTKHSMPVTALLATVLMRCKRFAAFQAYEDSAAVGGIEQISANIGITPDHLRLRKAKAIAIAGREQRQLRLYSIHESRC